MLNYQRVGIPCSWILTIHVSHEGGSIIVWQFGFQWILAGKNWTSDVSMDWFKGTLFRSSTYNSPAIFTKADPTWTLKTNSSNQPCVHLHWLYPQIHSHCLVDWIRYATGEPLVGAATVLLFQHGIYGYTGYTHHQNDRTVKDVFFFIVLNWQLFSVFFLVPNGSNTPLPLRVRPPLN